MIKRKDGMTTINIWPRNLIVDAISMAARPEGCDMPGRVPRSEKYKRCLVEFLGEREVRYTFESWLFLLVPFRSMRAEKA